MGAAAAETSSRSGRGFRTIRGSVAATEVVVASSFDSTMNDAQVEWRKKHVATCEMGSQNGKKRPWILPRERWQEGLWPGIRRGQPNDLEDYLRAEGIQRHTCVHNLKSSWMLGANLYFAHRLDPAMLGGFLAANVDSRIAEVEKLELEWAAAAPLDPPSLLGEPAGHHGAGQTSPDVAFVVRLGGGGRGLVLTEVKFTEHSFYPCSGRNKRYGNPDRNRCLNALAVFADPHANCHLTVWAKGARKNRRYWEYISVSEHGRRTLRWCPASTAGYQLFRQQALAEAVARRKEYELVVSCVAHDGRNGTLSGSLKRAGVADFAEWGCLFEGRTRFATFTHQEWVRWVRANDAGRRWRDWLEWVEDRYALAGGGRRH